MWWQRNIDQYWTVYANNRLHEYLYIVAAFVFPEVLAIVLFIVPWLRNFIENSSWRVFHLLTWWFQVNRCFVRHIYDGVLYRVFVMKAMHL
jgi:callose synthase